MPQIGIFILSLLTNARRKIYVFLSIFYGRKKNSPLVVKELKEMAGY